MIALLLAAVLLAPPPQRVAEPATRDVARKHAHVRYMARGCFHVAPRQYICPEPAPRRHR